MKFITLVLITIAVCVFFFFYVDFSEFKTFVAVQDIDNEEKRYQLQFSGLNVRPTASDSRAIGYGYIQLSNSTESPAVCWSFTAIGLIQVIHDLNIHGPLEGNGENSIISDIFIPLKADGFVGGRYESCIKGSVNDTIVSSQKISQIYKDPSKFYILATTASKPSGALWSNFEGQWDIYEYIKHKEISNNNKNVHHN